MTIFELLLIAAGLSMDAFAVSVCRGLSIKKITLRQSVIIGLYFGVFQAVMPTIGYFLGAQFSDKISAYDHWIVFILLSIIGIKMIAESFAGDDKSDEKADEKPKLKNVKSPVSPSVMLPLAIATSIDALAVGISFAFLKVDIIPAVSIIGIITFILSVIGVKIGQVFGAKYKSKAEFAGGVILVLMGVKILLEHLNIINF